MAYSKNVINGMNITYFMSLYVGVGKLDITPPIGVRMAGYAARLRPCEGIHDPLYVRSIVIRCENDFLVLVSLDLAGLDASICSRIKNGIASYLKLSKSSVIVTSTHTHSGPQTGRYGEDWADSSWIDQMVKKAISSTIIAASDLREALMGYGEGELYTVSENRREREGPIDPKVRVIAFNEKDSGCPIATLVNFSMHPVVLRANNTLISADYPGYLCNYLEKWEGGMTVFLQGTCGDIRPKILGGEDLDESFKRVKRVGKILAAEALKTREQIESFQECKLIRAKSIEISLNIMELPPLSNVLSEIKTIEDKMRRLKDTEELMKMNWKLYVMRRVKFLLEKRIHNGIISSTLTYVKLGDLVNLLTLPGEPLVRVGFKLREVIGSKRLVIIGYSNDYIGYIPSIEDYRKGGYEATPPWCIINECGIKELMIQASTLLKEV